MGLRERFNPLPQAIVNQQKTVILLSQICGFWLLGQTMFWQGLLKSPITQQQRKSDIQLKFFA
ncbi:MAG: hypothetical protein DI535_19140 [Citrobacter freundii]|nr:MAG: hypothetical protein DI535_19140 [Citrobacter freundii]